MQTQTKEEQLTRRLARITELQRVIAESKAELFQLLGIDEMGEKHGSAPHMVPKGFKLKDSMLAIFRDERKSFTTAEMVAKLATKYGITIPRKNIQSSLDYLFYQKPPILRREGAGRGNVRYSLA